MICSVFASSQPETVAEKKFWGDLMDKIAKNDRIDDYLWVNNYGKKTTGSLVDEFSKDFLSDDDIVNGFPNEVSTIEHTPIELSPPDHTPVKVSPQLPTQFEVSPPEDTMLEMSFSEHTPVEFTTVDETLTDMDDAEYDGYIEENTPLVVNGGDNDKKKPHGVYRYVDADVTVDVTFGDGTLDFVSFIASVPGLGSMTLKGKNITYSINEHDKVEIDWNHKHVKPIRKLVKLFAGGLDCMDIVKINFSRIFDRVSASADFKDFGLFSMNLDHAVARVLII